MEKAKPRIPAGRPCALCGDFRLDFSSIPTVCIECKETLKAIILAQRAESIVIYDHTRPECIWAIVKPKEAPVKIRELMTKYNKVRFATRPKEPGDSITIKQN